MRNNLKSRIMSVVLIIAVIATIFSPMTAMADTGDSEEDTGIPYVQIGSENFLSLMSISTPIKHYVLTEDIVISGDWKPISGFTGTFDGGGHTITFNIDKSTGAFVRTQYLGLFASCTDATIKNLYVNGDISLTTGGSLSNPNVYIGGVVASSTNSTLENVHFSGNINVETNNDNSSWAGGLVGKADNTKISLCSNTASITTKVNTAIGISQAGGLCGEFSGTIDNSYNLGKVLVSVATDSPYAGGLVGKNKGSITKSYNAGTVKSQGSGMSLSDVYAGGIAAISETGSSITDCAVMSSEISVVIGWVNTGYKNIIAKGGNKSNNIALNSISGSPSNDANSRYTNAKLKTTEPYSFDFSNTWAIDGTINNGYPYHHRNSYAINTQYQNVPSKLQGLIDSGYITINDIKQTDDGFTLCTKPLGEIFSDMGITMIYGKFYTPEELAVMETKDIDRLTVKNLKSWYIYSVGTNYSILKMRGYEEAKEMAIEQQLTDKETVGMGTSIPFMDFDMSLINTVQENLSQDIQFSQSEFDLYTALDKLIYGKVNSDYTYCIPIANYFSKTSSKGNYLIAEEYIEKILEIERDADGYINVPSDIEPRQVRVLEKLPDGYDNENKKIKVSNYNLTNVEKKAILACRTGDVSLNAYALENIAHARLTIALGNFLQSTDISIEIEIENQETLKVETTTIQRETAKNWFGSAVKSDNGVSEEKVPKEYLLAGTFYPVMAANFGNV